MHFPHPQALYMRHVVSTLRVGSRKGQHIVSKKKAFVIQEGLIKKADSGQLYLPYYLTVQPFNPHKKKEDVPPHPFALYLLPGNQEYEYLQGP